jgi:hypothetical protein
VTNAARFATLHRVALELLDRLYGEFDVERIEPYQNDDDLDRYSRVPLARPTVALMPRDPACALPASSSGRPHTGSRGSVGEDCEGEIYRIES